MRLRAHRRNLVMWSPSAGPADTYRAPRLTRTRRIQRTRRIHRCVRTCALLAIIGLMRLVRGVRPRWRPLLAGGVLTVAGVILRSSTWGAVLIPGLLFLFAALLTPGEDRERSELERELAVYSTPAQRADLEATLERYSDNDTYELRDILASQAMATGNNEIPGTGDQPA